MMSKNCIFNPIQSRQDSALQKTSRAFGYSNSKVLKNHLSLSPVFRNFLLRLIYVYLMHCWECSNRSNVSITQVYFVTSYHRLQFCTGTTKFDLFNHVSIRDKPMTITSKHSGPVPQNKKMSLFHLIYKKFYVWANVGIFRHLHD